MKAAIPSEWYDCPPRMLVTGCCFYARALAQLLRARQMTLEMLRYGPQPLENGSFPSVLDSVDRVLLCVEETVSTAEAIWQHDRLWHWLESLTGDAEYHEVGFIFIVGDQNAECLDAVLRVELGYGPLQDTKGITLWRQTEPLPSLLRALNGVGRTDLQTARTLRANPPKRQALVRLKSAILSGTGDQVLECAKNVAVAFQRHQVTLDNFCNPPFHPNGKEWRRWISQVVTEGVTQKLCTEGRELLPTLNL